MNKRLSYPERVSLMPKGYPLLVDAYPAAQLEAGHGIAPQELAELFLER